MTISVVSEVVLPKIASCLSIFGSTIVIIEVVQDMIHGRSGNGNVGGGRIKSAAATRGGTRGPRGGGGNTNGQGSGGSGGSGNNGTGNGRGSSSSSSRSSTRSGASTISRILLSMSIGDILFSRYVENVRKPEK